MQVVTSPRVMAAIEEILQFENETQMEKYRDDFEVMAASAWPLKHSLHALQMAH